MIRMKSVICLRMRYPRGERASAATVHWHSRHAADAAACPDNSDHVCTYYVRIFVKY
jgi:hypothetical protein